jgi:hypothetical protein
MVLDYDTGAPSPLLNVRALIATGYHGGDWLGKGITTSAAAAAPPTSRTALGYAEAAVLGVTNLDGQSADATSVLIRYTLSGDADLNRAVDMSDFTRLASNFNQTGRTWLDGDFNYDGTVDLTDFAYLAANFNQSMPAPMANASAVSSVGQSVPEPASCGALMCLALPALLSRRARRRIMSRAWTHRRA